MPEADASKYLEQSRYFENDEDIKMTNLSTDMIISLYLRAKDRDKEICVLAELTASDTETIMEVLKDAGVYSGAYKTCSRCGARYPVLPHKLKRNSYCPECARMKKQIDNHKQAIKRNLARINELQRNNVEHKEVVDELEAMFADEYNRGYTDAMKEIGESL